MAQAVNHALFIIFLVLPLQQMVSDAAVAAEGTGERPLLSFISLQSSSTQLQPCLMEASSRA